MTSRYRDQLMWSKGMTIISHLSARISVGVHNPHRETRRHDADTEAIPFVDYRPRIGVGAACMNLIRLCCIAYSSRTSFTFQTHIRLKCICRLQEQARSYIHEQRGVSVKLREPPL